MIVKALVPTMTSLEGNLFNANIKFFYTPYVLTTITAAASDGDNDNSNGYNDIDAITKSLGTNPWTTVAATTTKETGPVRATAESSQNVVKSLDLSSPSSTSTPVSTPYYSFSYSYYSASTPQPTPTPSQSFQPSLHDIRLAASNLYIIFGNPLDEQDPDFMNLAQELIYSAYIQKQNTQNPQNKNQQSQSDNAVAQVVSAVSAKAAIKNDSGNRNLTNFENTDNPANGPLNYTVCNVNSSTTSVCLSNNATGSNKNKSQGSMMTKIGLGFIVMALVCI